MFKSILTTALILGVSLTLSAQPMGGCDDYGDNNGYGMHSRGGMGHGEGHGGWFSELNLTDEQKIELQKLRDEIRPIREKNWEEVRVIRKKIREELAKDQSDRATLTEYSKKLSTLTFNMTEAMNDHVLKMREVFTKEQYDKMNEVYLNRRAQGGKRGWNNGMSNGHRGCW